METLATSSAHQDEVESTGNTAEEDPEESDKEYLTPIQHLVMIFEAWIIRFTMKDAFLSFPKSIIWIWTQSISWIFAAFSYIFRRVFKKTTFIWILAALVGFVAVAVYGWVASVHASVYGWAGSVLHIGPWSICMASRGSFFRTACYPNDTTAEIIKKFSDTYANFDTAVATRNLISTAPIDLRSSRSSLHRDLLRLRALNVTLNIPNADFPSIDSQTVNVLEQSKTIPDVLFRYLSRLASTMAVVD